MHGVVQNGLAAQGKRPAGGFSSWVLGGVQGSFRAASRAARIAARLAIC